jgi:hypothetical protein
MKLNVGIMMLAAALLLGACSGEDAAAKKKLVDAGFSESAAGKLSGMNLTAGEIDNLSMAKRSGLDENAAVDMVKSEHDRNLKFDLGSELQIMVPQGISSTALVQLVDMGAIPRWGDDIRELKDVGMGDVTIVEIAKLRFKDNKEVLSGGEYGRLKRFGMSDAGVLAFARKGGNAQQLQKVSEALQLGKSEQAALASVGM